MSFNDRKVDFISPKGYRIKGNIKRTWDDINGLLHMHKIGVEDADSLSYAMPKLSYDFFDYEDSHAVDIGVHAKEDGTCIIIAPIYHKREIVDVITRTRTMPNLTKDFEHMFSNIKYKLDLAYKFVEIFGYTLMFEMFGSQNKHEIEYCVPLDIKLITVRDENGILLSNSEIEVISRIIKIPRPDSLFRVIRGNEEGLDYLQVTEECVERFGRYWTDKTNISDIQIYLDKLINTLNGDNYSFINLKEVYNVIAYFLEETNKKAGKIVSEGVVFTVTADNISRQIKCKPETVREGHRHPDGVPAIIIRKVINKYYDEHSDIMLDKFKNNPDEICENIENELLEDYPESKVKYKPTRNRINYWLDKFMVKKFAYHGIVSDAIEKLLSENNDLSIEDIMREFAKKYPQLKKYNGTVYSILKGTNL